MTHRPVESNTDLFFELRRGLHKIAIGASEGAAACGMNARCPPYALYHRVLFEPLLGPGEGTDATRLGHLCEPLNRRLYEVWTGERTADAGHWGHRTMPALYGCSPDALLPDHPQRLLEIKSPYSHRYESMPVEHVVQTLFQMWVCERAECDYVAVALPHEWAEEWVEDLLAEDPTGELAWRATEPLLTRVHYSAEFVERTMKPRLFLFSSMLARGERPPLDLFASEAEVREAARAGAAGRVENVVPLFARGTDATRPLQS